MLLHFPGEMQMAGQSVTVSGAAFFLAFATAQLMGSHD